MKTSVSTAAIVQTPELQAVLQHQEQLAQANDTVAQLKQLIADHQDRCAALQERAKRVTELETQREDLLADIATGQSKQAELEALDTDLAQLKRSIKEQSTQAATEQTIAGLERKLAKAQDEADLLTKKTNDLIRSLLLAQAEELGAEYAQVAARTNYLCRRLRALDSLLRAHGQYASFVGRAALEIPRFELRTMPKNSVPYHPDHLYSQAHETFAKTLQVIDQEKVTLRTMGVQIS